MKIGIVVFDLQKNTNMIFNSDENINKKPEINQVLNYAMYIDNNEPNKYFEYSDFNINDLPTDVLWFSNLNKDDLWISGYLITHNIKDNQFFNTHFNSLMKAVSSSIEPINLILKKMLFIFEKLVSMGIVVANAKYDNHINTFSYSLNLNSRNKIPDLPQELKEILPFLHQPTCKTVLDSELYMLEESEMIPITLKRNGIVYVENVLENLNLPTLESHFNYQILDYHNLIAELKNYCFSIGKEYRDIQTSLNYVELPFIVNVSNREVKPLYQKSKVMLSGTEVTKTLSEHLERSWLTSEEFHLLSKFFNFKISKAIFFDKLDNSQILPEYAIKIPQITNISYFSLISCIFLENYLISLYDRERNSEYLDLLGVFISAKEKTDLLIVSMLLEEKGFKVVSYGNNKINLFVRNASEIEEIEQEVNKMGFYVA